MSATTHENHRDNADLALVVYLEELVRGKRVLLIGETAPRVERRLSDAARTIDVASRERRARSSRRGLPVRGWPSPAEKGAWDLVIVPDLAQAGLLDAAAFAEIAALVVGGGVLAVALDASADAARYEAFYELVAPHFPEVRVLGQAPMSGYAVVDFAAGAPPEVAFDGSAGGAVPPSRWLAIAGPDLTLDPYAIIAVAESARPAMGAERAPTEPNFEREAEAARSRLEHAEKRLEQAQREIARGAQKLDEARHERERMAAQLRENVAATAAVVVVDQVEDEAAAAEYRELEARLARSAHETTLLRVELERRAVLVRDLVEEVRSRAPSARALAVHEPGEVDAELRRVREALVVAQRRAVEAETNRAELAFRADELATDLAAVAKRHDAEKSRIASEHASTEGTVRGLASRLAELNEVRLAAEGRLVLVEDDLRTAREREITLERALSLAEEQLAVARMRPPAPSAPSTSAAEETSEREGKLFGSLLRAREELGELTSERMALLGEVARLRTGLEIATHEAEAQHTAAVGRASQLESDLALREAQLAIRNAELDAAREGAALIDAARASAEAERDEALARLSRVPDSAVAMDAALEATTTLAHAEAELDVLRAERTGLSMRLTDVEQALDAARASIDEVMLARDEGLRVAAALSADVQGERRRLADLAGRLGARDAMVSRLASEVAHGAATRTALEGSIAVLEARLIATTETIGALEAVASVRGEEERREKDELVGVVARLEDQVSVLDADRAQATEALRDVRETLSRLDQGLAAARSHSVPPIPGGADAVVREQLARLAQDADDRELMLRSLTAQLEERDDRIRALERLARGERPTGDAKMLEADERIARLTSELHEERRARTALESGGAISREVDLRRLEQLLTDREAQLMQLEGRVDGASREEQAMRDAFADARARLEAILQDLGSGRAGEATERLANVLHALRRY